MSFTTPRSVTSLEEEIRLLEEGYTQGEPENKEEELPQVEVPKEKAKETPKEDAVDWKSRYNELRRLQQKTAEENKQLRLSKASNSERPPLTEEEVSKWIKENPKAHAIIRAVAVDQFPQEDLLEIKAEIEQNKALSAILKVHADFNEISDSDEFHDWAKEQPESVQNLVFSNKAADVIWAVSRYKADTRAPDQSRDAAKQVKTKSSGSEPSAKSAPVYSESSVQKMSIAEYEKHEPKILEAQKAGNFVYDLSAGAR